jgi:hypothetical protein
MSSHPENRSGLWCMLTRRTPEALLVWIVLAIGALLPWCVAIGVKLYLDFHGRPTWGWRYFLHPGIVLAEIWTTVCLAAPSLVLAVFALQLISGRFEWLNMLSRLEKAAVVAICAAWGAVGSVPVFVEMFWEFHPISLFFPFFWTALYIDDYALGLFAGFVVAFAGYGIRYRKSQQRHQSRE